VQQIKIFNFQFSIFNFGKLPAQNGKWKMENGKSACGRLSGGFTLVELLVALMVMAIVLTAAGTMAGALSSGKAAGDQAARNGSYLMQIQSRLSDLIMRANSVVDMTVSADGTYYTRITLWTDNDGDSVQDASELTQIQRNADEAIAIVSDAGQETYSLCGNVRIYPDNAILSSIRSIVVKWEMVEHGVLQTYSVCGTMRGKN
jgi:prepilin-type N-terminal cleavage/methylation domain-containing protein